MKIMYILRMIAVLLCTIHARTLFADEATEKLLNDFNVYVLLEKKEEVAGKLWKIKSKSGFYVSYPFNPEEQETIKKPSLLISQHEDELHINGKPCAVDCLKIENRG